MAEWMPARRVVLEVPGSPDRDGVGAIRAVHSFGTVIRERITTFDVRTSLPRLRRSNHRGTPGRRSPDHDRDQLPHHCSRLTVLRRDRDPRDQCPRRPCCQPTGLLADPGPALLPDNAFGPEAGSGHPRTDR
ncbi:hypothetical protein [Mycolicibacterium fortuitum]